ncbi:MAG: alpha-1,2-fucosyltransferase [Ruminiclostridium sp.]
MKIVLLDGGLANQMTQYIFARCLEEETNDAVFLDDLWFHVQHDSLTESVSAIENHSYQLDKFPNIKKIPLMSEYFDKKVWEEIVNLSKKIGPLNGGSWLPQILKSNGLEFFMIAEAPLYRFDGMVARMPYYNYIPEMLKAQGNVYYFGWFTNGGWFMKYEKMFRHELSLPILENEADIKMANEIYSSFSIGIHIRCSGGYKAQGITFGPEYYSNQIDNICKQVKNKTHVSPPIFFIFSDDIKWCKDNFENLGLDKVPYQITFGEQNRRPNDNQCDMKLMSMCDILLLNNSVYGYMAALLNDKPEKIIINPIKTRGIF